MATVKPNEADPEWVEARRDIMRLCAEATRNELAAALTALAPTPEAQDLRAPETGLVMLRGRTGGEGAPFNLGEASIVRAAVRLEDGGTGFAYHLGRDAAKARTAAVLDALWQRDDRRGAVRDALAPVRSRLAAEAALAARQTAATRVNFFTLVRGED
jgi:alpha-D-ribose 1-methylphosphonate 5-triphosphate synthase subunit PhnG